MDFDATRVVIDLDAISDNIDAIREKAGVPVMAVIKADAYGHGAVQVARLLKYKCAFFCVSSILEALELRDAGLTTPILILGYTPVPAFPAAVSGEIRPAIFHEADAQALSQAAQKLGRIAKCHLAVDTGMSRIGFQVTEEDADACERIAKLPNLEIEGIFSHFATADSADLSRSYAQAEKFDTFVSMLKDRGVNIPIRHLDNSAGLMNFREHYEMVRSGIITYGMYPSDEVDPGSLHLTPALSWHSRITHLKTLAPGREISYGGTYETKKELRVATIPVGCGDGYPRQLSNKGWVLIHGKKTPILGRVCMDQFMVDVTDIPEARQHDQVTLVGQDGDAFLPVETLSELSGRFNYEFVCCVGKRVPRVYYRKGVPVPEQ